MTTNSEALQPHRRADELDVAKSQLVGKMVGEVRLFGHIAADADHGAYAGCKAVVFRRKAHWWSRGVDLDEQLNRYFAHEAKGCLLAKVIPLSSEAVVALVHRSLDEEAIDDLADFQQGYSEFKAKREKEREEAKEKAQAEQKKKAEEERAAVQRQMEVMKLTMKAGLTHLSNCKKASPEEIAETKATMERLAELGAR